MPRSVALTLDIDHPRWQRGLDKLDVANIQIAAGRVALGTLGSRLRDCIILSDAGDHASMIEGIRHSRCTKVIWKHHDVKDLEAKLKALPANAPKIVAFESVYSMDGAIAPIKAIVEVAENTVR